jgi:hypothetical protein
VQNIKHNDLPEDYGCTTTDSYCSKDYYCSTAAAEQQTGCA